MAIVILDRKPTPEQLQKAKEEFGDYVKVVVDTRKELLAAGGERLFQAEQLLLENGSKQSDLWGGGIDLATREVDYNSIINLRPNQDNPSRDLLSKEIRSKFDTTVKKIFF